jgi:hypothetical protein
MSDEKYMFIDELPAFLLIELGLRLSVPTLHKMHCIGTAPPGAGWWGKRRVYKPTEVLAWAAAHIGAHPGSLGPKRQKKAPPKKRGKLRNSHATDTRARRLAQ